MLEISSRQKILIDFGWLNQFGSVTELAIARLRL